MQVEYHAWQSDHLGRWMELKTFGNRGVPFIVFPCSRGRFYDYESFHMVDAISQFIERGSIMLVCVDSLDEETWYNFGVDPGARNWRYEQWDQYLTAEVVPFIRDHFPEAAYNPMTTGNSMGAYHAVNIFLKHPDIFAGTIALSGLYTLQRDEFGLAGQDISPVYFNSPINYLENLSDSFFIDLYRQRDIIVCTGQGAWEEASVEDARALDNHFRRLGVPAWVDYWGYDVNHDWPWWFRQMNYFLHCLFG